jgi:hypothetical protein
MKFNYQAVNHTLNWEQVLTVLAAGPAWRGQVIETTVHFYWFNLGLPVASSHTEMLNSKDYDSKLHPVLQ